MNNEAQNIAIYEVMGMEYHKPTQEELDSGSYYQYEPDFTRSLDSCHEMEKLLKGSKDDEHSEICSYEENLIFVCGWETKDGPDVYNMDLIRATAAQRAEAFLKTLNLWKP